MGSSKKKCVFPCYFSRLALTLSPQKQAMDALVIINKYYADNEELKQLLLHHSLQVANRALDIARQHPEMGIDTDFVAQAAMLHYIGIFLTDAPGIHCHGTHHYLMHGYLGGQLMRELGMPRVARVCERHTGTGLTPETIAERGLPLPPGNYRPETLEEELICYADKFYSKSHPDRVRSVHDTALSLEKFGHEGVVIFKQWVKKFEPQYADGL